MKKLYKQASDELNKALLKRRQSHQMAETFASPGLVYGGALGLGSLVPRSLGAYARLKPLLVEGRDPNTGEERKAKVLHTGADIMQGTALASVAAELAAPIVAAITPTRTAEEQTKADKSDPWKAWLIPGVASYNKWKRLGRALHATAQKKTASALNKSAADPVIVKNDPHVVNNSGTPVTGLTGASYTRWLRENAGLGKNKKQFIRPALPPGTVTPQAAAQERARQAAEYGATNAAKIPVELLPNVEKAIKRAGEINFDKATDLVKTKGELPHTRGGDPKRYFVDPRINTLLQGLTPSQKNHVGIQMLQTADNHVKGDSPNTLLS